MPQKSNPCRMQRLFRSGRVTVEKTILRYLKGSRERGITYGSQDQLLIERCSDFDWAGDKKGRKSTSGFIFVLNGGPVSWCSKRQPEATWLRLLLMELGLLHPDQQHALIKVSKQNTCAQSMQQDLDVARGGEGESKTAIRSRYRHSIKRQ